MLLGLVYTVCYQTDPQETPLTLTPDSFPLGIIVLIQYKLSLYYILIAYDISEISRKVLYLEDKYGMFYISSDKKYFFTSFKDFIRFCLYKQLLAIEFSTVMLWYSYFNICHLFAYFCRVGLYKAPTWFYVRK